MIARGLAMERKLAAILAADVVGYSTLMEADEAGTFNRLRAGRKELFEPEIEKHHGRIFKLMGDGLLAEFSSVVDAVECAVMLQRGMAERNASVPETERIQVRIGINLGEVIIDGEDRYGEGVNIAARIQQLAEPGGICVSGKVSKEVEKKLAFAFKPMGVHQIKNIAEPIAVYRVMSDGISPSGQSAWRIRMRPSRRIVVALPVILIIGLVSGAAWYAYHELTSAEQDQGIPVIAVIPFQDLTGDRSSQELGKGIAEAFMSDLATFPDYEVVSAATSFALADKPITEIVKLTGATFVVEGSIRRAVDKVKVTMQLIRGSTDRHLMTAEIEEPLTDLVSVQSSVALRLRDKLGGMTGILRSETNKLALAKRPADLTEYDYYILGHVKHFRQEGDGARDIWQQGLQRFPDSMLLRCKMVFYHLVYTSDHEVIDKLVTEARKLRPKSKLDEWYLHWASAWNEMNRGNERRAIDEAEATIAIAPYDTVSRMDLSYLMSRAGRHDKAIEWATYAAMHDPTPLSWYRETLADVYRSARRLDDLHRLALSESEAHPQRRFWYEVLYTTYKWSGQPDQALKALEMAHQIPDTSAY